jgi:hypothetical protein
MVAVVLKPPSAGRCDVALLGKSVWFDEIDGWKRRWSMLSEARAIRAHPVHGKGTSHLSKYPDGE